MELQYEELNCFSCVLDTVVRREESRESIVSDSMPDIGAVITVNATPLLHKTWVDSGAAGCEGSVCAAVIYAPDDGGTLCSISMEIPFRCSVESEALGSDSRLNVIPQLIRTDVKVINPRKVMLRAEVSVRLIGYASQSVRYTVGTANSDQTIQTKLEPISFQYVSQVTEKRFPLEDDVVIGSSHPPMESLLSCDITPYCAEAKIVGSKIVFKGGIKLRIRAQNEDQELFSELCEVPVSQVLDAGNSREGALVLVNLFAADRQIALRDSRTLAVELELYACATVVDTREGTVLSDAYSTRCVSSCVEGTAAVLRISAQNEQLYPFRVLLQRDIPSADLVDLNANLGEWYSLPEGESQSCPLQLSACLRERDGQMTSLSQAASLELPVSQSEGKLYGSVTLLDYTCTASASGLEVRGNLMLRYAVLRQQDIRYISEVSLTEQESDAARPSAVLRRLRAGETLWDLGKEYLASVADILAVNQISDESAVGNQFLLIPHSR